MTFQHGESKGSYPLTWRRTRSGGILARKWRRPEQERQPGNPGARAEETHRVLTVAVRQVVVRGEENAVDADLAASV